MKTRFTMSIDKNWRFGFLSATALYLIIFALYNLLQPAKNYHALHLIDKSIKHANEIIDEENKISVYTTNSKLREKPQLKLIRHYVKIFFYIDARNFYNKSKLRYA